MDFCKHKNWKFHAKNFLASIFFQNTSKASAIIQKIPKIGKTLCQRKAQVHLFSGTILPQSIDAFPYNGPGTSNGARPAGRDRVLHAFACRMSASRRKKGKKTLTFLVLRLLDNQRVEGLSEEAGGRLSGRKSRWVSRQGQSRDWCPRQHTIGRSRSSLDHGRKYSSSSFFFFFLSLSHEAFFYSSFFLRVMFLFGEPKRSSTAAVAPKTNATLSLPSLWLRLTFSLHDRSTRR